MAAVAADVRERVQGPSPARVKSTPVSPTFIAFDRRRFEIAEVGRRRPTRRRRSGALPREDLALT